MVVFAEKNWQVVKPPFHQFRLLSRVHENNSSMLYRETFGCFTTTTVGPSTIKLPIEKPHQTTCDVSENSALRKWAKTSSKMRK